MFDEGSEFSVRVKTLTVSDMMTVYQATVKDCCECTQTHLNGRFQLFCRPHPVSASFGAQTDHNSSELFTDKH